MSIQLISPANGELVSLQTELQKAFAESTGLRTTKKLVKPLLTKGKNDSDDDPLRTRPLPVKLKWNGAEGEAKAEISADPEFTSPLTVCTDDTEAEVYNLMTDTVYYWRVNGSEPHSFTTADERQRWIFADGCSNVRECAAWKGRNGETFRKGLIYRGMKPEILTELGIKQLRELGIRTELDLRKESTLEESPLGTDVRYVKLPCEAYADFFTGEFSCNIKPIFELLADESAYPIYFHCAGGADRTGTVAMMLGAVLGVDYEQLVLDYELIQLDSPSKDMRRTRKGKLKPMKKILKAQKTAGKDMTDKAVSALRAAGVSDETMDKIRKIYTGGI